MSVVFWLIAAMTTVAGLAVVLLKNLVHSALALTVVFTGIALLFLDLDAQFVGFVQILVYVGAVAILVVFAILLTRQSETPKDGIWSYKWIEGLVISAAVFAILGWAILSSAPRLPHETAVPSATVLQIGNALMTRYVLPLEIIAVLLTVAMIGAVLVAMSEKEGGR
jgi:NADH:ubiquinone oxidoreductase subunit 6 (subunit J)